jgi:hypothetical protein
MAVSPNGLGPQHRTCGGGSCLILAALAVVSLVVPGVSPSLSDAGATADFAATWQEGIIPCNASLWASSASIWMPYMRYTMRNCTVDPQTPPLFVFVLPNLSTHGGALYFGNIAIAVYGGNVAPRIVLPLPLPAASQESVHVVNVSLMVDEVNVWVTGGSTSESAALGVDHRRGGGILLGIVAQSWRDISVVIRRSVIVMTRGWAFNWTSDPRAPVTRIAGLVSLAISAARNNPGECSGNSAMFLVANSTINVTGVMGVGVMFHLDLSYGDGTLGTGNGPATVVNNVQLYIVAASTVVFEMFPNEEDICTSLVVSSKLRLSDQFIFLVAGRGDSDYDLGEGTAVANVSCEILNSCVRMLYNADKRCRGNRSRMDAGIAHLRGHSEVRNITFQLSGTAVSATSTAVMVDPISTSLLTTADAESAWSRAFVFGISNVNSTTGVAVHLNSGSGRVTASDYSAYVMLFNVAVLSDAVVRINNSAVSTTATGWTGMLGRVAGVVVLEFVNVTLDASMELESLIASVQSLPGNGTVFMASSTSMVYVKGGIKDSTISLRSCHLTGNATGGAYRGPLLMVTTAAVTFLPTAKEFNITRVSTVVVNTNVASTVLVVAESSQQTLVMMVITSIALVISPMLTVASTIEITSSAVVIAAIEVVNVGLKRSVLGALISSTPIPSEELLKVVAKESVSQCLGDGQSHQSDGHDRCILSIASRRIRGRLRHDPPPIGDWGQQDRTLSLHVPESTQQQNACPQHNEHVVSVLCHGCCRA